MHSRDFARDIVVVVGIVCGVLRESFLVQTGVRTAEIVIRWHNRGSRNLDRGNWPSACR